MRSFSSAEAPSPACLALSLVPRIASIAIRTTAV